VGGLAVAATLLSGSTAEAFSQSFQVTTTAGSGPGSLRAGIGFLNNYAGPNTITFESTLSGSIDLASALPKITEPLTITGPGARTLAVNGDGHQMLTFDGGPTASDTISGLTLTGANAGPDNGGAIYSYDPTLNLTDVTISGNQANYGGGIMDLHGHVTLSGSTISGNTAAAGGGMDIENLTASSSTIADNTATEVAGGVELLSGASVITDSTISGNIATDGGTGGGVYVTSGSLSFQNTIVAGNSAQGAPDIKALAAVVPTASFSLIGNLTGSGITPNSTDITGKDPELGALADNGGPTDTMLPAANSPVIDQGNAFGATQDQRGLPRPVDLSGYPNAPGGDGSDIGAVELQLAEGLPVITGLSVSSGPAGATVVLTGRNLADVTRVLFGSAAAKFTIVSNTEITATAPAGSGSVDVVVSSPGGESAPGATEQFSYPQTTTANFDGQQLTLTTPPATSCTAATTGLAVRFSSAPSSKSKLKFLSVAFYIDRGIKHSQKRTKRLKNGKRKRVEVVIYVPNVLVRHVPSGLAIKLAGEKSGTHTLKVLVSYTEKVTKHHRKVTITVTKTLKATFRIC
jgi:hypothetical protein